MQSGKIYELAAKLIFAELMSFSLIYALTTALHLNYTAGQALLLIAVILIAASLLFYNRLTTRVTLAALTAAALISLSLLVLLSKLTHFLVYVTVFADWTYGYINDTRPLVYWCQIWLILLIAIPVSLLVFLFTVKKFNFYVILVGGSAIFITQWMLEYFVSYTAFYLFVFLILVFYLKSVYLTNSTKQVNEFADSNVFTLWISPVCGIILIISLLIPASSYPVTWKWLDEKVDHLYNFISNNFGSSSFGYFSLDDVGFGSVNGKLGGNVGSSSAVVLKVSSPRPMYLKGSAATTYTGSSWTNTDNILVPSRSAETSLTSDIDEMKTGMRLLTGDIIPFESFYEQESITVTFEALRTKSLFLPPKVEAIYQGDKDYILDAFCDLNGALSTKGYSGRGFSYKADVYSINYDSSNFRNALYRSEKGLYNQVLSLPAKRYPFVRYDADFLRKVLLLKKYSDEIYSKYLSLPETLPARVRDLARSITEKETNNYDKVKAIEKYLSTTFPYTLNPGNPPKKRDFVDSFLFETKKGYCTYYASAMVVMTRCIGIPARYVEGYMMPRSPDGLSTVYSVTNRNAHAWPEVYFEGFGWLQFEPTAPFNEIFYNNMVSLEGADKEATEEENEEDIGKKPDMEDQQSEAGNLSTQTKSKLNPLIKYVLFVLLILIVLAIFILYNYLRSKIRLFKMINMNPRESVLSFYKFFTILLAAQEYSIRPGETAYQYSERVDRHFIFNPVSFKELTKVFVKARYSKKEVSEQERKLFQEFYEDIYIRSKANIGSFKFFYNTYLLGKY